MTASATDLEAELPPDPSFTPAAYERTSRLLRSGVIGFLVLSSLGLILGLVANPSESVSTLIQSNPFAGWGSVDQFFSSLASLKAPVLILLGVFVMVGVSIARVLDAMVSFFRGHEVILAVVCAVVSALLLVGLVVVSALVH